MRITSLLWVSLIVSLGFLWACKSQQVQQKELADLYFDLGIVQGGEVLIPVSGVYKLKKQPFQFKLRFKEIEGVHLSCAWDTYYYDYSDQKDIFFCDPELDYLDCAFLPGKTCVEDRFNEDKDILVGGRDYQLYWFYDPELDWYRMDKGVKVKEGVVEATVTVEHIFDLDLRDELGTSRDDYHYPIEEIQQDIYLVLAASVYDPTVDTSFEGQRERYILRFE